MFGKATGYTDNSAAAGKTYVYAVDAFDASGNRSARTKGVVGDDAVRPATR